MRCSYYGLDFPLRSLIDWLATSSFVTESSAFSCSDAVYSAPLDGACHDTGLGVGAARSDRIVVDAPSGGACDPQGSGTAVGQVSPNLAHTVCCTPSPVQ